MPVVAITSVHQSELMLPTFARNMSLQARISSFLPRGDFFAPGLKKSLARQHSKVAISEQS